LSSLSSTDFLSSKMRGKFPDSRRNWANLSSIACCAVNATLALAG
jgi:hypothetical protein